MHRGNRRYRREKPDVLRGGNQESSRIRSLWREVQEELF